MMIVPFAPGAGAAANFSNGRWVAELYSPPRGFLETSFTHLKTRQNPTQTIYLGIRPQVVARQPLIFWWRSWWSGMCRWFLAFLEIKSLKFWTHCAGAKTRFDSCWFVTKRALLSWRAVTRSLRGSLACALARLVRAQYTCLMGFMMQSSMESRFWQSPARRPAPYSVPGLLKELIRLAFMRT